jgi:hypothetical protein
MVVEVKRTRQWLARKAISTPLVGTSAERLMSKKSARSTKFGEPSRVEAARM